MTFLSFHESHVHLVLQRLLENKLFVSREKCEIHPNSVSLLGCIVEKGQIRVVNDRPTPTRSHSDASLDSPTFSAGLPKSLFHSQGTVCREFSSLYIEDHFTLSHYTLGICHVWLLGNSIPDLLLTAETFLMWEILVFYPLFNQITPELDLWELIWPPHWNMLHCDFVQKPIKYFDWLSIQVRSISVTNFPLCFSFLSNVFLFHPRSHHLVSPEAETGGDNGGSQIKAEI